MTDCIIIGSVNPLGWQTTFPLFKDRKVFLGYTLRGTERVVFNIRGGGEEPMNNCCWYNTLKNPEIPPLNLTATYSPERYPKFDNYDAINVDRVSEIPCDYYGTMGVPITFFVKWNAKQFEVLDISATPLLHGRSLYKRVFIRRRKKTDYIIVGNKNAMLWKTIFPRYFNKELYFGYNYISKFRLPDDTYNWFQGSGRWFTTFPVEKINPPLTLVPFNPDIHKTYDTYPAVNTDSINEVPDLDKDTEIGVPIGIIDYLNPEQFEITGMLCRGSGGIDYEKPIIDGKHLYTRVLIKRKD